MARSGYLGIAVIAVFMALSFEEGTFCIFSRKNKIKNEIKIKIPFVTKFELSLRK